MKNNLKRITSVLTGFVGDESGQDLIEYALVAAIIALGSVAAMGVLATGIASAFGTVGTKLSGAV
jgi:pilus assembly protein Flp/PilA